MNIEQVSDLKMSTDDINIKISLCIPTKGRFDTFLSNHLDEYLCYLDEKIIDEIVICDEDGKDYNKIIKKYKKIMENNENIKNKFKLYKNNNILGVFLNKIKVCMMASHDYIALIDSDNFCERDYFKKIRDYIKLYKKILSEHFILAPSFAKTNFNFKSYENEIIRKENIISFLKKPDFGVLINTGNYVLTKNIITNLKMNTNPKLMELIRACDVMYFILLVFQQFKDVEFHIVKDLEYIHAIHDDSEYLKTYKTCIEFREKQIKPQFFRLNN